MGTRNNHVPKVDAKFKAEVIKKNIDVLSGEDVERVLSCLELVLKEKEKDAI